MIIRSILSDVIKIDLSEGMGTGRRRKGWGGSRKGAGRPWEFDEPRKISLVMEQEDVDALQRLADQAGESFSTYTREILRRHVDRRLRPGTR